MSDIVERLRELEAVESELAGECDCPPEATANWKYANTCKEAADEITRLRNELHIAQEWSARVIAGHEQDMAEITALRAENEKLRAALEGYVCTCTGGECAEQAGYRDECGKPARAALEEKP